MDEKCVMKFVSALQKAITAAGIYIGAALLQAASSAFLECAKEIKEKADNKIVEINAEADATIKRIG